MLGIVLLIIIILLLVGAVPTWSYSKQWGNGPASILVVVLIVVVILLLTGYIPFSYRY